MSTVCKSCGAAVFFAPTMSGQKQILDLEPNAQGNIYLDDDGYAVVITAQRPAPAGRVRYISHYATCKDAERWRSRGQAVQGAEGRGRDGLVLSRRIGERVAIDIPSGERIWVKVVEIRTGTVRLGFLGDKSIVFSREELFATTGKEAT